MFFEEKQKLNIWWVYLILGIQFFITLMLVIFGTSDNKPTVFGPSILEVCFLFLVPVLIILYLQQTQFYYRIDTVGITYKYSFLRPSKTIEWPQIAAIYIRKFDAFSEYGGIGLRYRLWFKFKDRAFIFNQESKGLQILYNEDRKLLITSNRIDELAQFLINLKNSYPNLPIETHGGER